MLLLAFLFCLISMNNAQFGPDSSCKANNALYCPQSTCSNGTWTVSGCNIGSVSWICNDTLIVNGDFIVQSGSNLTAYFNPNMVLNSGCRIIISGNASITGTVNIIFLTPSLQNYINRALSFVVSPTLNANVVQGIVAYNDPPSVDACFRQSVSALLASTTNALTVVYQPLINYNTCPNGFVIKNMGLSAGAIAGLVIGVIAIVAFVIAILALIVFLILTKGSSEIEFS